MRVERVSGIWLTCRMTRVICLTLGIVTLAGCANLPGQTPSVGETRGAGISSDIVRPKSRPDGFGALIRTAAPAPTTTARTIEQFDTTTAEQRAAATQTPQDVGEMRLGVTIASLGSPTEPGFWLKTPLVSTETEGRVFYPATGKSVQVTLIPIDGPVTAGSRMSLPALRLLEAPLTGLPEVEVFADA